MIAKLLTLFVSLVLPLSAQGATLINGAGATFPQPIYSKWFAEYAAVNKDVRINYNAIGSGGGINQLLSGTVDFGATDEPMNAEETKKAKTTVVHIPTVLGAVAVSYNLAIKEPLKLTGEVLADIFLGSIKTWNDERILQLNPGVKLPAQPIAVAYRSDGSGTTAVFTDYLSKVSKVWTDKVGRGKSVSWPVGMGAKGNSGVAGVIGQNPGSIGYVELVFAATNKLAVAQLKNKSGAFVSPSAATVSAAAAGRVPEMIKNDFKLSITDSDAKDAYPISAFTWLLFFDTMDKAKGLPLIAFTEWALGPLGQKMATDLNYAPLPAELTQTVLDRVKKITIK